MPDRRNVYDQLKNVKNLKIHKSYGLKLKLKLGYQGTKTEAFQLESILMDSKSTQMDSESILMDSESILINSEFILINSESILIDYECTLIDSESNTKKL